MCTCICSYISCTNGTSKWFYYTKQKVLIKNPLMIKGMGAGKDKTLLYRVH